MGLIELILIALGLYIAFAVLRWMANRKRKEEMGLAIAALPDFRCAYQRIGMGARDAVAIDEGNGTICFFRRDRGGIAAHRVHAADIAAVDVFESRTTRTVQSGGGAIVMVGRIGVPVGSPRQTTFHKITRVEVRTTVNDPARPLHTLTLLNTQCAEGGRLHALVGEDADLWCARIRAVAARTQRTAG